MTNTIFRSDREATNKKRRGRHSGGVAVYLRNDLASISRSLLSYSSGAINVEVIYSEEENLLIACLYRQPDDSTHGRPSGPSELKPALKLLSKAIHNLENTPDIIIGGDFNLPNTSWPECSPTQGCSREEREMIISFTNLETI